MCVCVCVCVCVCYCAVSASPDLYLCLQLFRRVSFLSLRSIVSSAAMAGIKLPPIEEVRKMHGWSNLVTAVKNTKQTSGRNCLSHHMSSKGAPNAPIESLKAIGFSGFKRSPGSIAGGGKVLQFPALFASPDVDQQTFIASEGGYIWRYDGVDGAPNISQKDLEEETACEIIAFLFSLSPKGVVMETHGRHSMNPWSLWWEHKVRHLREQAEVCHSQMVDAGLIDSRARVPCRQQTPSTLTPGVSTGSQNLSEDRIEQGLSEEELVPWLRERLQETNWTPASKQWLWGVLKNALPKGGLRPFIEHHSDEFEMQEGTNNNTKVMFLRRRGGAIASADGSVDQAKLQAAPGFEVSSAGMAMGSGSGGSGSSGSGAAMEPEPHLGIPWFIEGMDLVEGNVYMYKSKKGAEPWEYRGLTKAGNPRWSRRDACALRRSRHSSRQSSDAAGAAGAFAAALRIC